MSSSPLLNEFVPTLIYNNKNIYFLVLLDKERKFNKERKLVCRTTRLFFSY